MRIDDLINELNKLKEKNPYAQVLVRTIHGEEVSDYVLTYGIGSTITGNEILLDIHSTKGLNCVICGDEVDFDRDSFLENPKNYIENFICSECTD